jgi:hypothetical protein
VSTDANTETGTVDGTGAASRAVPAPRAPGEGETHSGREPALALDQQGGVHQTGTFAGLAAALRSVTAPRPVVPAPQAPPSGRRLLGVCGWAALLDLAGFALGVRALVGILASKPPQWYLPAMLICGAVGIGLTAAAFLNVRRGRLPWVLLGGGTGALVASFIVTAAAT